MEQELRFGLDLGQMANFAFIASKSFDLWNHHMYISTEMIQFVAHFDVSNIYQIKKKTLKILETFSIVSCSIRNTSPRDLLIMTLIEMRRNHKCKTIFSKENLTLTRIKSPVKKQKSEMPLLMVDKSFLCGKCLSGKLSYLNITKEFVIKRWVSSTLSYFYRPLRLWILYWGVIK